MNEWANIPSIMIVTPGSRSIVDLMAEKMQQMGRDMANRLNENLWYDPMKNAWSFRRRAGARCDNGTWYQQLNRKL